MVDVLIFSDSNGALGFGRYAGPYRIATELRQVGYSVQVVEFFAEWTFLELQTIIDRFAGSRTLWVGFSSTLFSPGLTSAQIIELIKRGEYQNSLMIENWQSQIFPKSEEEMQAIFAYIRERAPSAKIVVGGSKAARGSVDGVDWWIWGEADVSAVEFTHYCKDSAHPLISHSFGNGSRRIISNDYPITEFSKYQIEWHSSDHIFAGEHLPIELSRGCIFKCSYCSFKNLGRSSKELVKPFDILRTEMLANWEKHKVFGYMLSDDTFNDSLDKVQNFHQVATSLPFKLEWAGYCRVDLFAKKPEMIKLVKESGARFINFGIETFHAGAGRAAGKGMNPDLVKETLHRVKQEWGSSVLISCNFIVGLKHEPEESVWKSVEWLLESGCPVDAFNFTPLYVIHNRRDVYDKTAVFANQIGLEPEKHGYEYESESAYWKHEHMDRTRAHEIVAEIYQLPEVKKKILANRIGFFGRLRNLDFDFENLTATAASEESLLMEIHRRKIALKDRYLTQLSQSV